MKKKIKVHLKTEYKDLYASNLLVPERFILEITDDFICHRWFFEKKLDAVMAIKRYRLSTNQQNKITD